MKVAVVTPYYKEDLEVLRRCHESVRAQTHPDVVHYMLADGHPQPEVDSWDVVHIKLPGHGDSGNTPRAIGALSAAALGAEAIVLLDADNWFDLDHIGAMVAAQAATKAPIVTCARWLCRADGSRLAVCKESDGVRFTDTNCYLITKAGFHLFGAWGYKNAELGHFGDRAFWEAVRRSGLTRAHSHRPTVNYWTTYAVHYQSRGEAPPEGSKVLIPGPNGERPRIVDYQEHLVAMAEARTRSAVASDA